MHPLYIAKYVGYIAYMLLSFIVFIEINHLLLGHGTWNDLVGYRFLSLNPSYKKINLPQKR